MSRLEFAVGLIVIAVTLWDAFETVVLPRTVARRIRLTRFIVRGFAQPWVAASRLPLGEERDTVMALFGPLVLLVLVAVWAIGLIFGFALLADSVNAVRDGSRDFGQALYFSGTTLFTLGLGDVTPANDAGRALSVVEAGSGLGFLALIIAYLPIFYQAFSRREVAISLLDARAGSPPTAIELIRRNRERVSMQVLAEWETWSAELLETHLSYPILAYFRSQHEHQSWLAALVVILDASALLLTGLDGMPAEQARFTFAMARHALVDLTQVFFVEPLWETERLPAADFAVVERRLASYGFPFNAGADAQVALASLRRAYEPMAIALSRRLLIDLPGWLPADGAEDNWQTSPWDSMLPL